MNMRALAVAAALMAVLGAASCATDSYHAYQSGEGYSEQRLSDTSWRVSFAGSAVESQQAVEQRLLRRAAELTLQSGYDWFAPEGGEVQGEESVVVAGQRPRADADGNADAVEAVWRPRWRRRSASRWTDWDPQGAIASDTPELAPAPEAIEIRYAATADIVMGRTPAPDGAFDARAVLAGQ